MRNVWRTPTGKNNSRTCQSSGFKPRDIIRLVIWESKDCQEASIAPKVCLADAEKYRIVRYSCISNYKYSFVLLLFLISNFIRETSCKYIFVSSKLIRMNI